MSLNKFILGTGTQKYTLAFGGHISWASGQIDN
jgi:hypothetical protein